MKNQRLIFCTLLSILFIAIITPRILLLDNFVTPDEPRWLTRSANFYHAVSNQHLSYTYQTEHPGVTIMWLGAFAFWQQYPEYAQEAPGQFLWDRGHLETWLEENSQHTPLDLLVAARYLIALSISLILAFCYWPLQHLLGSQYGFIATLMLGWTPFGIALSRQLHPDGLLSAFVCLSLLTFSAWAYGRRNHLFLLVSGLSMALALVTKVPAISLLATIILLMAWLVYNNGTYSSAYYTSATIAWVLLVACTIFIMWPILWTQPLETAIRILNGLQVHAAGHSNTNYFLGQITDDPGPMFYPIIYFFRSTPATVIGILSAIAAFKKRFGPFSSTPTRQLFTAIILFTCFHTLSITLGMKKFDRYFLPAILPLEVIVTLGWASIGLYIANWLKRRKKFVIVYVLIGCLLLHALPAILHYPHYFTYYNPLGGGANRASKLLLIGWGEGLSSAARWLNQQPHSNALRVVSWYPDGPFSYFFTGTTGNWKRLGRLDWMDTDYAVLYANQWQRELPTAEMVHYFDQYEPVHVIHEGGLDLVRIYDLRDTLIPDDIAVDDSRAVDFNHEIRLIAYDLTPSEIEPGDSLELKLHLQNLQPMDTNYNLLVQLLDQNYVEHWRTEGWPWGAPTREWHARQLRTDVSEFNVPPILARGFYRLNVTLYNPITLDNLPITDARSGELVGDSLLLDYVTVKQADENYQGVEDPLAYLGDAFILQKIQLGTTPTLASGQPQNIHLQWQTIKRPMVDYTVFIHLLDANGRLVAQHDGPPMQNFIPTSLWRSEMIVNDVHPLTLPLDMPQGEYRISIGLYDPITGARMSVIQDDKFVQDAVIGPLLRFEE